MCQIQFAHHHHHPSSDQHLFGKHRAVMLRMILLVLFLYAEVSGYIIDAGRYSCMLRNNHLRWMTTDLTDLISSIPHRKTSASSTQKKSRLAGIDRQLFSRTNRVEGQMKWIHEMCYMLLPKKKPADPIIDDRSESILPDPTAVILELAKELLYSGIPEQALQLYGTYCDYFFKNNVTMLLSPDNTTATVLPVVNNSKLLALTSRAFIALHDVKGSLSLLQASSQRGVAFDNEAKSLLMADLARSSAEGLSGALQLRQQMLDRGEAVGAKGVAGILCGLRIHGLGTAPSATPSDRQRVTARSLLFDGSAKPSDILVNEEENWKRFNASTVEEIAIDVADRYFRVARHQHHMGRPRPHHSVSVELLRLVFRSSVLMKDSAVASRPRDNNRLRYSTIDFQLDEGLEREERTLAGLHAALSIMKRYGMQWSQQIADALLDECLREGDALGVQFVSQKMVAEDIPARTSTYNALLRRYAEDGDAEGAHWLVHAVMGNKTRSMADAQLLTAPNTDTWALLIRACLPTRKGRFIGRTVIDDLLLHADDVTKEMWDLILEHSVLSAGDRQLVGAALSPGHEYVAVLCQMVATRSQPDDVTVLALYRAFLRTRDTESALQLYKLQRQGEQVRDSFWNIATKQLSSVGVPIEYSAGDQHVLSLYQNYSSLLLKASANYSHNVPDVQKLQLELLVSMCLPPLSVGSINALLELLGAQGKYKQARSVLRDVCTRAKKASPATDGKAPSSQSLLRSQLQPDRTTFALVIEACLREWELTNQQAADGKSSHLTSPNRLSSILDLLQVMEKDFGLQPDRRIYAALISAFGQSGDAASALGVFQEMRQYYFPDVGTLQSVLDVCLKDSSGDDLLRLCPVLEALAGQSDVQLEVYSKDVLLQGFPDARSLGEALQAMEQATRPGQCCVAVSLDVLSVLVQAVRSSSVHAGSLTARPLQMELARCLAVLGAAGVRLESETREYFRMPAEPALNSPHSRHYHRLFVPQKRKQRSLLDIDMPPGLLPDLDVPLRGYSAPSDDAEPRFESGGTKRWSEHARAMVALLEGADVLVHEEEPSPSSEHEWGLEESEALSPSRIREGSDDSEDRKPGMEPHSDDLSEAFKHQIKPPKRTADVWVPKASARISRDRLADSSRPRVAVRKGPNQATSPLSINTLVMKSLSSRQITL